MNQLAQKGIGPRITEFPLEEYKTSDTVFLLGSGSSINDISDEQWNHIDSHDSIGLNRWPIHEFTPTYYVFEHHMNPNEEEFNRKHWKMIDGVGDRYEEIPVIMKDTSAVRDRLELHQLPRWLRGELILSSDSAFPQIIGWNSSREKNERLLKYLDYKGHFDPGEFGIQYRKRGSISYLIHLSTVLGYENIVLCGVDLVDSKYFFETEKYENGDIPIPWRTFRRDKDDDTTHKVNDSELGQLTLENVIHSMHDTVLKPRDISLYTETEQSALHPQLPLYPYDH